MRGVVLLFLLLLLVPHGAAEWGHGTLESIALRDGTLEGGQAVVQVLGAEEGALPELDLRAERIHVETWRKEEHVNAAGLFTYTVGPNTTRSEAEWSDARVTIRDGRPDVMLFLSGTSEVRLQDARMVVGGHTRRAVTEATASDYHRPPSTLPVPSLHEVGATSGLLTLQGNFSLSVYEWDLLVENETHSEVYWSGFRNTNGSYAPMVPGSENQRLYLDVTNGILHLPLTGLDVRDLFVAGTSLEAASAVLDLPGGDAPLNLAGPLHFALEPVSDGTFPGRVVPPQSGPTAGLSATSAAEAPAPMTVATSQEASGLWWTAIVVLVLAVAAVFVARRVLRLLHLRRARDDGDYGAVAAGAGLENSRRFGAEVVVARVVCMVKTGDLAAAASLLERRGEQLAPAVRAYLWACVHAGSGAVEDAREAVVRSVLADPGMAVEVAANRSLRRFLADVGEGGYS